MCSVRGPHQRVEETLLGGVLVRGVLGVPLHGHEPGPAVGEFDGFDGAVGGAGGDGESLAQPVHVLVVVAGRLGLVGAGDPGQGGAGGEGDGASVINSYADFLRGLTATTLDAALAKGTFDFVKEVSADFPINVLARLLDVPPEDNQQLIDWGNRIIGNTDPDYADVLLHSEESEKYRDLPFRSPASLEVFEYGRELARQRRGGSGTDLVSRLVNETPRDGVPLSPQDFDNYFLLLVVAGNETTRHTITHSMLALLQHPEQLARLKDDPSLIPTAVEEFLRWASPVYHFRRTATRDVELGGKRVKEGDKVVMWFASGNRDEEVFGNPYDFDVTRQDNDHVTFGKGSPHLCLGNLLARTEIRIMFEELIPRLADIRLAGDVPRVRSNFVNGIKKLPVAVTLA